MTKGCSDSSGSSGCIGIAPLWGTARLATSEIFGDTLGTLLDPFNPHLSGQPNASVRDDTGVLQPETQSVAGGDPRAQQALHAVHGRFAYGRSHESLAESTCAARREAGALRDG